MTIQQSTTLRTNKAGQLESTVGTAPILEFFTGSPPANCAAADSGTKIGSGTLPSDWLAAASSGAVSKTGTWTVTGITAASTGTNIGHFRLKDSGGTTCHLQGTVTVTGGGGDMTVDNISLADDQVVTVNIFTLTEGGA